MKSSPSIPLYALSGIHSFLKSPFAAIAFGTVMEELAPSIPYVGAFTSYIEMASVLPVMISKFSHSFHNGTARRDFFNASKIYVRNLCTSALTDLPFAIAASYILPASVGFSVTSYLAYTVFGKLSISEENKRFNINEILCDCVAQPIEYFLFGKLGLLLGLYKRYFNLIEVTNSDAVIESNKENTIKITYNDLLVLSNKIKEELGRKGYNNHINAIKFYVSESPMIRAFSANPMGKDPLIFVSKGMIAHLIAANHTKEDVMNQLTAIMAHECGHVTLNHHSAVQDLAKNTLNWVSPSSNNLGSIIFNFNSQRNEYQADKVSVKVMGESESFSKAMSATCGYTPLNNEGTILRLVRIFNVFTSSIIGLKTATAHPNIANRISVANKFIADMPQQESTTALVR
jgi:Zn-dependent protease with chaperone function